MGLKGSLKVLAGKSQEANKIISEQFSNLEDKMLTIQENQLEFENYLKDIRSKLDRLLEIDKIQNDKK